MDPLTIAVCTAAGVYVVQTVGGKLNMSSLKDGAARVLAAGQGQSKPTRKGTIASSGKSSKSGPIKG